MSPDVLVVGGGVSGLCAAVDLASRGHSVVLAEQNQHLGGRVYSFRHTETGDEVDNGQHLMLGCYHATLRYLRTVHTIGLLSLQSPLDISFRSPSRGYRMRAPMLPPPLHVLGALIGLESLSWRDRLAVLRIVPSLLAARPDDDHRLQSMTVDRWLTEQGQGPEAKQRLWNILSIGTLNERPEIASAALFVKVLQTVFLGSRSDASIALPRAGLSRLFGDGGADYLASHGGRVLLGARAADIVVKNHAVESVTVAGRRMTPRAVVSAVPYHAIERLVAEDSRDALPQLGQARAFTPVPIVSIHLWYDRRFMDEEFTALLGSPVDWVFNKTPAAGTMTPEAAAPASMHLSLVISAARIHGSRTKEDLAAMADGEVRRYFPGASGASLVHWLVIKEKRATFSPGVGHAAHRARHATPVRNFFIAGDWTDTKLPATIEGAAQSGYACAALADEHLRGALQGQK